MAEDAFSKIGTDENKQSDTTADQSGKKDLPEDPLATGLPDWDLLPPQVVIRRKARKF